MLQQGAWSSGGKHVGCSNMFVDELCEPIAVSLFVLSCSAAKQAFMLLLLAPRLVAHMTGEAQAAREASMFRDSRLRPK